MTVYYLNSSAWLKRYFAEPGLVASPICSPTRASLACSPLGYVEVVAGLARQYGNRPTAPDDESDLLNVFESHWRELLKAMTPYSTMPERSPGRNGFAAVTLFIWPPLIPFGRISQHAPLN